MNKELKQDLELARNVLADTQSLYEKYCTTNVSRIIDLLTVAVECDMPVEELEVFECVIELSRVSPFFHFIFVQNPLLTHRTTYRTCEPTKWYIVFSYGEEGALNISPDSNIARQISVQQIWREFVQWVKSYNPIDWDGRNGRYIFSIEDGYKLHQDFHKRYHDVLLQVERVVAQCKITELQAKIDELKESI